MKNGTEHMMNQNIKKYSIFKKSIEFRLDILYLCLTIEHQLEIFTLSIFKNKKIERIDIKEFFEFCKLLKNFRSLKKEFKYKKKKEFLLKKQNKKTFFNLKKFISNLTFGELIRFIKLIKNDLIKKQIEKGIPKLELKVFKKGMEYIKNIRNLLVHRNKINSNYEVFFKKLPFPAQSKNLETNKLFGENKLKKQIFKYFIENFYIYKNDKKIISIFKKYNI